MKILEMCEDHYMKSHKKCEDGGVEILNKRCEIIFEQPLRGGQVCARERENKQEMLSAFALYRQSSLYNVTITGHSI